MKVVLIGAGNVATVLGRLMQQAGHEMLQVVSRNADHAALLAQELGCGFADHAGELNREADVYLLAVTDAAMTQLDQNFHLGNKLVIHTAGAVSKEVLQLLTTRYGVMYPLQSLRKEKKSYESAIPLMIDGNTPEVIDTVHQLASSISDQVTVAGDEQRLQLHVAAVLVSNFTNHLYALADEFCEKEGINFRLLQPLIEETALRIRTHAPAQMQTGPAIRKDIKTMEKHLRLLANYPRQHHLYLKITDSIMNPPA